MAQNGKCKLKAEVLKFFYFKLGRNDHNKWYQCASATIPAKEHKFILKSVW